MDEKAPCPAGGGPFPDRRDEPEKSPRRQKPATERHVHGDDVNRGQNLAFAEDILSGTRPRRADDAAVQFGHQPDRLARPVLQRTDGAVELRV